MTRAPGATSRSPRVGTTLAKSRAGVRHPGPTLGLIHPTSGKDGILGTPNPRSCIERRLKP